MSPAQSAQTYTCKHCITYKPRRQSANPKNALASHQSRCQFNPRNGPPDEKLRKKNQNKKQKVTHVKMELVQAPAQRQLDKPMWNIQDVLCLQQKKHAGKCPLSCWTLEEVHELLLIIGATKEVADWFLSEQIDGYAMEILWHHVHPFSELAPDMFLSDDLFLVLYAAIAVLMAY
jgi:hypothetical protein